MMIGRKMMILKMVVIPIVIIIEKTKKNMKVEKIKILRFLFMLKGNL